MSKARDLANFPAATGVVDADIGITVASTAANTFTGLQTDAAGADLASAATINLTAATGNTVVITGTVATSALTMTAGQQMVLLPSGAWPMTFHAATMNINGGVDQVCAAGDRVTAVRDLAGVIRVTLVRQSGVAVVAPASGLTLGTPVASTSGTAITFTGIPAGTKLIIVNFSGVSTNGTVQLLVQIGDSGGIETSNYSAVSTKFINATNSITRSNGFCINNVLAANTVHGTMTLVLENAAAFRWTSTHSVAIDIVGESTAFGAGTKALSAELTQVRITMDGVEAFDAGEINIAYI